MVISGLNTHIIPYWGNGSNLKLGLNQLGIRNVSEQLFSVLLPGLNNVSLRVRYYSFYCWIIAQFYKDKDSVNTKDFYPFVRRAEFLVALINAVNEDHVGVPGINYASAIVDNASDGSIISLKDGADINNGRTTYWSNSGGVLRQYYGASLCELGLVGNFPDFKNIYNITKEGDYITGILLADEFDKSINDLKDLFLNSVNKGEVSYTDLLRMKDGFYMKYLSPTSQEREILQSMILQSDSPSEPDASFHRRNTIIYTLDYLSKDKSVLNATGFSRYMYESFDSIYDDLTAWGWYAYYLDNNWQYQFTEIFHNILNILKNAINLWTPIEEISTGICETVLSQYDTAKTTTLEDIIITLPEGALSDSTSEAFRILLLRYKENVSRLDRSLDNYKRLNIHSENFFDFVKEVKSRLTSPFYEFVKFIIEDIIYRHYRVSFRKMMQTGIATQKFAFENGSLRFIDNWDSTNTSPRIDTLKNFMIDLSIIASDGNTDSLTSIGANLLNQ